MTVPVTARVPTAAERDPMMPVVPSTVPTDRTRKHHDDPRSDRTAHWQRSPAPLRSFLGFLEGLSAEGRDAFLYGCSAVFAGVAAVAMGIPLYRQWGQLAVGPYALAAVFMVVVARRSGPAGRKIGRAGAGAAERRRRRWNWARVVGFVIVLFGATLVPLSLEVVWRSEGNAALHVQPEVVVVQQAGVRAAQGKDPYRVVDRNGHLVIHQSAEPPYELYYPYLPGMVIFGFSSGSAVSGNEVEARLTDARIQFLVFTVVVSLVALSRLRPPSDARGRSLQVLTVLPTAALPLATGGDDMPVAALMLLGLAALQRRRPVLAGLALGAASSLKFTAWPLVVFGLWVVRDLSGHRAAGRYALGVVAVVGPVVFPVALRNPSAFVDNVIRFPLGLAGVSSPAASALPGHILVSAIPGSHRIYVAVVGIIGLALLALLLARRPPGNAAQLATFTGWVMLIAILLAPATRVGYLLYPINLFVWAWMLRRADDPARTPPVAAPLVGGGTLTSPS
jgi:MYXO-CTERM domain-containing protein